MRIVVAIAICSLALLLVSSVVHAEVRWLGYDDGEAESMEYHEELAHFVHFFEQSDWSKTFSRELQVYGQRYGDVGEHLISIVLMGEQSERFRTWEDMPDSLIIFSSVQFMMSDVPEEPGWFTVPLELIDLPDHFHVGIFSRSTEEFGVKIGRTSTDNKPSYSCSVKPSYKEDDPTAVMHSWEEGGNWMLRLGVSPNPKDAEPISSDALTGGFFESFDDGEVDGFSVFQRGGPCIHIKNNKRKKVKRVYIYAQVDGDWYNTNRNAAVYLLDSRRRIILKEELPYNRFTNDPTWSYTFFDGVWVPKEFYVQVEPFCRPGDGLEIGYDLSSENQGSEFGTVGAIYDWSLEMPVENTNWMIRVEYQ